MRFSFAPLGPARLRAVTLRLDVLHCLGEMGVPVLNSARAVEVCVDKAATSFALARTGYSDSADLDGPIAAGGAADCPPRSGARPSCLKPLFGAQGFGLKLIRREDDLPIAAKPPMAPIIFSVSSPGARRLSRHRASSCRRASHRRHDTSCRALDHQCQTWRPAGMAASPTPQ